MRIYRYQKMNEKTLRSLKESTLWFSRIEDYNDPFEFWCNFDFQLPDRGDADFLDCLNYLGYPKKDIMSMGSSVFDIWKQHEKKKIIDSFYDLQEKWKNDITCCCFSKKPDIVLMWSHYAQGLTGVCIEYSLTKINGEKIIDRNIHEVKYRDKSDIAIVDLFDEYMRHKRFGYDLKDFFEKQMLTKAHFWNYEEEFRILKLEGKSQKYKINKDAIKTIVFGEKIDPVSMESVKDFYKDSNVLFKMAMKSSQEYKIDIVDL